MESRNGLGFWLLAAATGALSGLGAAGLERLLRLVERLAWPPGETFLASVSAASAPHRMAVLALAGLLVSAVLVLTRRPLGGHGTAQIIESIWYRGGRLQFWRTLLRGVLSIVGVGLGVSLGREGALIQSGAAAGSKLAEKLRLSSSEARLLVACGAASGIGAAYNVPIGAAVFGLEVLLGSLALELLGPIVVSCVLATLVSRTLLSAQPSYLIPHYSLLRPQELGWALAVGLLVGLASAGFVRVLDWLPRVVERLPERARPALPTVATLATGAVALAFPAVLGNGYDAVNAALHDALPLRLLLLLPLLKLAATAACSASGIPGGLFTPSLFFGGLLGGAVGALANAVVPGSASPGSLALLGMAASLAGTTHAAASSVLILFELTADYGMVLPLMLTAVVAVEVSRRAEPHSLYTAVLNRRKVPLPVAPSPLWMRSVTDVRALVEPARTVPPMTPFGDLLVRLLSTEDDELFVADEEGRFLGIVTLAAIKGHIGSNEDLTMVVAADVMDPGTEPLSPELSLAEAALRCGSTELHRLPVIDRKTGKLLGTMARRELFKRGTF
ncbi:MAG TPA: chloride channel protein [Myxococcales bacterium]|jgi:CIC family chloride channel protein